MNNYESLREKREKALKTLETLFTDLSLAEEAADTFYRGMRWEENNCSEEEYEKLFSNLIPDIENGDVLNQISDLKNAVFVLLKNVKKEGN